MWTPTLACPPWRRAQALWSATQQLFIKGACETPGSAASFRQTMALQLGGQDGMGLYVFTRVRWHCRPRREMQGGGGA